MSIAKAHFGLRATEDYCQTLQDGVISLQLAASNQQIEALVDYLALLDKWNKAYNLSAIREPKQMLSKHLLDSLSILAVLPQNLHEKSMVDVGSGAGLPGIPLALFYPDCHFTLLDSNGKKARFLFQVKQSLALTNIAVENRRVESWQVETGFDYLVCRAYASLPDIVESGAHLLNKEGKILAMKGLIPRDELREVEKHYIVDAIHALKVPGVEGERNLIVLTSSSDEKNEKI